MKSQEQQHDSRVVPAMTILAMLFPIFNGFAAHAQAPTMSTNAKSNGSILSDAP